MIFTLFNEFAVFIYFFCLYLISQQNINFWKNTHIWIWYKIAWKQWYLSKFCNIIYEHYLNALTTPLKSKAHFIVEPTTFNIWISNDKNVHSSIKSIVSLHNNFMWIFINWIFFLETIYLWDFKKWQNVYKINQRCTEIKPKHIVLFNSCGVQSVILPFVGQVCWNWNEKYLF